MRVGDFEVSLRALPVAVRYVGPCRWFDDVDGWLFSFGLWFAHVEVRRIEGLDGRRWTMFVDHDEEDVFDKE